MKLSLIPHPYEIEYLNGFTRTDAAIEKEAEKISNKILGFGTHPEQQPTEEKKQGAE